jgi:hypothetical protein
MSIEVAPPDDYSEPLIQARIELAAFEQAAQRGQWGRAAQHAEDARLCAQRLCEYIDRLLLKQP